MPDPNLAPRDPRINGTPYSWTSCAFFFNAVPYKGITKLEWDDSRKRVYVPSAQQDGLPQGITSGVYRVDSLSWTMLRDSAAGLDGDLVALGGGSVGDAAFDIVLQLFEPTPGSIPQTTLISGVQIETRKPSQEFSEDGGYLVTEYTAKALFVLPTVLGVEMPLFSVTRSLL